MTDTIEQLKGILTDIREKTGVSVRLFANGGEETEFTIDYNDEKVRAWVDGVGVRAEECARLVAYFVASSDMLRPAPEKGEYLKNILLGEGGGWYAYRFMSKYNLPESPCYAVCIWEQKRIDETVAHVEGCLFDGRDMVVKMDEHCCAVVKFLEDGQSPLEFSRFLSQSLYEEIGVKASIGIGCETESFSEISTSYQQAMTAVRMSSVFHSKGEVHSYKEYLLVRMLEDVPESRLKDYMEQFRIGDANEIFEDREMLETAEEFLENSLNVSETSRNLYMHRNTLMYRLDKIERATGLNIRNFADAVSFRVITIIYKLLQR